MKEIRNLFLIILVIVETWMLFGWVFGLAVCVILVVLDAFIYKEEYGNTQI